MNPAIQAVCDHRDRRWRLRRLFLRCRTCCSTRCSFRPRGPNAGRNITRANMVRPWLFLLPAIIALGLYLAYPVFATFWLSLHQQRAGTCRSSWAWPTTAA